MSLDEKVAKEKHKAVKGLADAVLPIFQSEDLEYHVDELLEEYQDVKELVDRNPFLRGELSKYVTESLGYHKYDLYGAKTVDSIDRVTGAVEIGAALFATPAAEEGIKIVTEPAEWLTKGLYSAYYVPHTGDWASLPYFAAMEAISLIPIIGEIPDMKNIYLDRLRKQIRARARKSFLEKMVQA